VHDTKDYSVAGSPTIDINRRIGFNVDDTSVYGPPPRNQSLYCEDDSSALSNNSSDSPLAGTRQAEVRIADAEKHA
jgi:hypothetical protein